MILDIAWNEMRIEARRALMNDADSSWGLSGDEGDGDGGSWLGEDRGRWAACSPSQGVRALALSRLLDNVVRARGVKDGGGRRDWGIGVCVEACVARVHRGWRGVEGVEEAAFAGHSMRGSYGCLRPYLTVSSYSSLHPPPSLIHAPLAGQGWQGLEGPAGLSLDGVDEARALLDGVDEARAPFGWR